MSETHDKLDDLIRKAFQERTSLNPKELSCPDEERIVLYLEGSLDDQDREQVEHHLADCPACQDLLVVYARTQEHPSLSAARIPGAALRRAKSLVKPAPVGFAGKLVDLIAGLRMGRSLAWAIPLLLVLLLPLGYFVAKPSLVDMVETRVQKAFKQPGFSLENLGLGWRSVLVKGMVMAEGGANLFSIGKASLGYVIQDLLDGKLVLDRIQLDSPYAMIGGNGLDTGFLLKGLTAEDRARLKNMPLSLSSAHIRIINGSADLVDQAALPEPVIMHLENIALTLDNLNYPSFGKAVMRMEGRVEKLAHGGGISGEGEFNPADGTFSLDFHLKDLDLPALVPYFRDQASPYLVGGIMDVDMNLSNVQGMLSLSGTFTVKELTFSHEEAVFFGIPASVILEHLETHPQGMVIPFQVTAPVEAGRDYFIQALVDDFRQGLS